VVEDKRIVPIQAEFGNWEVALLSCISYGMRCWLVVESSTMEGVALGSRLGYGQGIFWDQQ
jgi:hypothetical protein